MKMTNYLFAGEKLKLLLVLWIGLGGIWLNPAFAQPEQSDPPFSGLEKGTSEMPANPSMDADGYRQSGDRLRAEKQYDDAIGQYQRALNHRPDDRHSLFWIATIYRWTRRFDQAEAVYTRLLERHPDHVDAKIGLAYAFLSQGKLEQTLELTLQIEKTHPDHSESQMIRARALERQGEYGKATHLYESLAKKRPEDDVLNNRYKRMLEKSRPTLFADYRLSETRVLEGRGDPVELTRMEYFNSGYGLEGYHPITKAWELHAESQQKTEKLTLLDLDEVSVDRKIYDFENVTRIVGTSYHPDRWWWLRGKAGVTRYKNREAGSIENEEIRIYSIQLGFERRSHQLRFEAKRQPFLGRSTGGDFDFNLFTVNRFSIRLTEEINRQTSISFRGTSSHYSDGNNALDVSIAANHKRNNQAWRLTLEKSPLQERFLDASDLSLRFVEVYGIRIDFSDQWARSWQFAIFGSYRFYEDQNHERNLVSRLEYFLPFPFEMAAGFEEETDYFSRDSSLYNNRTILSRTMIFLRGEYRRGTAMKTKARIFAALVTDEGDRNYLERGFDAELELAILPIMSAGVVGSLETNTLSDRRGKIYGYLKYFF